MLRMPIQQQHIDELRTIYREEFGKELSNSAGWAMAHRLVNVYRMLARREQEQGQKTQYSKLRPQ